MDNIKISVVTTLYHSENYIEEFYERIKKSIKTISERYEIIFVNDGSPDKSLEVAKKVLAKDDGIIIIDLAKNFGQHKAMMTGMNYSHGEYVFIVDIDLEEKPELVMQYWELMRMNNDIDVVYGVLENREGSILKKISSKLFYRILNYLSDENMPVDISFSRLMRREYVKNLIRHREREMYIGGLWHINGFNQLPIKIEKTYKGISSYTFNKKIRMLLNAVTAFSNKPLIIIFNIGMIISLLSVTFGIYLIVKRIFWGEVLNGWTSIMVTIWFFFGITILCIGIVAVYLSKVFIEVKRRPYTIIKKVFRNKTKEIKNDKT